MNAEEINTAELVDYVRAELSPYYSENEGNAIIFRLFSGLLGYEQTDIILQAETSVAREERDKFEDAISQLKENKPVQYILGETEFGNVKIKVDKRVLIPRPETEELVNWVVKESEEGATRILDIGTGSGCIAIFLKKHLPNSQVMATDVAAECIELAEENAEANQVDINFRLNDILSDDGATLVQPETLDVIVSNPPYIQFKDRYQMDANILEYEPAKALFVDDGDPMLFYKAISSIGNAALKSGGRLYFEINQKFGKEVIEVMNAAGYTQVEDRLDIHNKVRFVRGLKE